MIRTRSRSGFTLLETILSLALTAIIIGMLATLSRQWLSSWSLGADRMESLESVTLAQNRLANDLATALSFAKRPDQQSPLFAGSGSEIIFISEPRKADATDHLIVIRYRSDSERGIVRSMAIYNSRLPLQAQNFSPAIALLPSPYQIAFSYTGEDGNSGPEWQGFAMPTHILFTLSLPDKPASAAYSVSVRANLPVVCSRTPTLKDCRTQIETARPTSPLLPQGQTPLLPQKVSP